MKLNIIPELTTASAESTNLEACVTLLRESIKDLLQDIRDAGATVIININVTSKQPEEEHQPTSWASGSFLESSRLPRRTRFK